MIHFNFLFQLPFCYFFGYLNKVMYSVFQVLRSTGFIISNHFGYPLAGIKKNLNVHFLENSPFYITPIS